MSGSKIRKYGKRIKRDKIPDDSTVFIKIMQEGCLLETNYSKLVWIYESLKVEEGMTISKLMTETQLTYFNY